MDKSLTPIRISTEQQAKVTSSSAKSDNKLRSKSLNTSKSKGINEEEKIGHNSRRGKLAQSIDSRSKLKKVNTANVPSNIQVHVRCRPLINLELSTSTRTAKCVKILSNNKMMVGSDREFNFDMIYGENSTQSGIFENSLKINIERSLEGYNFSAFAYGQTGAGKTYTMGTNYSKVSDGLDNEKGLIPLAVNYLFEKIKELSNENLEYIIKASFIEIYNEEIRDLLNIKTPSKHILLRDAHGNSVQITGITETIVVEPDDCLNLLWTGSLNRKTASTSSNEVSSRSHAIFILNVEKLTTIRGIKSSSMFKINFIDLAGSERLKKSNATGDRFKESVSINSGLLALSKVIMALAEESSNPQQSHHIPYRESKLTRILKDSLGGNSITLMIACISPSQYNIDETINTLNYSSFARSIKITPMKNEEIINGENEEIIESLKKEIEELKNELSKYKDTKFEAENYKLRGIIKALRNKLKEEGIVRGTKENIAAPGEGNMIEIENNEPDQDPILFDNHSCNLFSEGDDNMNELLDKKEQEINIEFEYSKKIKENLNLRYENDNLKNELHLLSEKLKEYKSKLGYAANILDNSRSNNSNDEETIVELKPSKNKKRAMGAVDNIVCTSIEADDNNNLKKRGSGTANTLNTPLNTSLTSKLETNTHMIMDKIKKLKDFQDSLKGKIIESERNKIQVIRNKNEEITYVQREFNDKIKMIKNMEKVAERNQEIIEKEEITINILKEELRNKSHEIMKIRSKPVQGYSKPSAILTSYNPPVLRRKNSESFLHTDLASPKMTNNNYISEKCQPTETLPTVDANVLYTSLKSLMKSMEDLILQKHKFLKRRSQLEKEKINFKNLMKINEERLKMKIVSLTKTKIAFETAIKNSSQQPSGSDESVFAKEKVNSIHRLKATINKLVCVNGRLEKLGMLQESTLKELQVSEDMINAKVAEIEEGIKEIRLHIANRMSNEAGNSNQNSNPLEVTELKNVIKDKEEKLVFLELDNMNKEKKIFELESLLKDSIVKFEEKKCLLQFELNSLKSDPNNQNVEEKLFVTEEGETKKKDVHNIRVEKKPTTSSKTSSPFIAPLPMNYNSKKTKRNLSGKDMQRKTHDSEK